MKMEQRRRFGDLAATSDEEEEESLDLSGRSLETVTRPSVNLAAITRLDLSNNNLECIPESLTARLLNVVVMNVQSNQLKSLPNSMGCMSKLRVLNVSGNFLQLLPRSIEDCRALEELIANFNQLKSLPDAMGYELIHLERLSVNSNKLEFLPSSTSHMFALRKLDAHLNRLHALPDGLENLTNLQVLNVSQNFQYLKSLPYSLGLLSSLTNLDVSYNSISTLPNSLACLVNLCKFQAQGNPLVSPPMDVVDQSIEAMREYLSIRLNDSDDNHQHHHRRAGWLGKLVKCGTFHGTINVQSTHNRDGYLLSDYRSIDGLTSPRHISMFSPRRLFSPRRGS